VKRGKREGKEREKKRKREGRDGEERRKRSETVTL
jgi:hypothetical protein